MRRCDVWPILSGMVDLPKTRSVPVIRADFSDDDLWIQLKEQIASPTAEGFLANVEFVEDPTLTGLDETAILANLPRAYPHRYPYPIVFVMDSVTASSPDHPLLVLNLSETNPSGPFRAVPRQVQAIENNLSTANMDFSEFARSTGADGVFRGL
jgi:hypothetical protein